MFDCLVTFFFFFFLNTEQKMTAVRKQQLRKHLIMAAWICLHKLCNRSIMSTWGNKRSLTLTLLPLTLMDSISKLTWASVAHSQVCVCKLNILWIFLAKKFLKKRVLNIKINQQALIDNLESSREVVCFFFFQVVKLFYVTKCSHIAKSKDFKVPSKNQNIWVFESFQVTRRISV